MNDSLAHEHWAHTSLGFRMQPEEEEAVRIGSREPLDAATAVEILDRMPMHLNRASDQADIQEASGSR